MARPLRIQYENAFYHVMNRGLERRVIFRDDKDYRTFLDLCAELHPKFQFIFHSYCLMPNHYHLFVQTPNSNLAKFMQNLNSFYTQYFNRRHKRLGPLFQGRYKAILVDQENYSLQVSRYIHLNPVKAAIAQKPEEYPWSSYRDFMKNSKPPVFLNTDWLQSQLAVKGRDLWRSFQRFTLEGLREEWNPLEEARAQSLLGDAVFFRNIKEKWIPKERNSSISGLHGLQKIDNTMVIEDEIRKFNLESRALEIKFLIYALKKFTRLNYKEIADRTRPLSHSGLCQIVRRLDEKKASDKKLSRRLEQLKTSISKL